MALRSAIVEDATQRDGRRSIRESHVHDGGREETVSYLGEADTDAAALLALHAQRIEEREVAKQAEEDARIAARWSWVATRGGQVLDAAGVVRAEKISEADAALLIEAAEASRG